MFLVFLALIPPLVGYFVWRGAILPRAGKWFFVGMVADSLWILAYASIELSSNNGEALWATRSAWIGPMLGAPAMYALVWAFVFERDMPLWGVVAFYLLSGIIHLPAMLGPFVVVHADISGLSPQWQYGPWVLVPAAFWVTILIASATLVVRNWHSLSWDKCNRLLLLLASTFVAVSVGVVTNQIMLDVLNDSRFYLVGPAVSVLPCGAAAWLLIEQHLPDSLATIGKVFPNAKSRFLESLNQFENVLEEFASADGAVDRLSAILGARVAFAPAPVGVWGTPQGRGAPASLWIPPEGRKRLYGRKDVARINHLASKIEALRPRLELEAAHWMTGWPPQSQVLEPRPMPYVVGSVASLRAGERATATLALEPGVILEVTQVGDDIARGIAKGMARTPLEVDYPDTLDEGSALIGRLTSGSRDMSHCIVIVKINSEHRVRAFEDTIGDLVTRGAKLLAISNIPMPRISELGFFREGRFATLEISAFALPARTEREEDLSALLDHFITDIENSYGRRFNMTPEEREALCSQPWAGSEEMLRALLERMIVFRWSADPSGATFLV